MPRWFPAVAVLFAASSAFAQLSPEKALATMKPADDMQVELFAAEPMLINPTAIDVDHLGRVWVAEAVNYRRKNFGRPIIRPEGDRIQVLIDETGEGKATKAVTFYQGPELYGPLSVLVLPQADGKALRVLVAQSPDILEFWDKDGDLKADGPPTKWLSGFGGFDHDHGVHGLTVGPDGKLYFTVGDSGVTGLQSKDGQGKKYVSNNTDVQKGTVWRIDLDGKNLELIAHNFRNNYEACVDSFGEIWLSDNDDDGNQQTRICFVMPGGNYGYGPRGPGQTHWHEEQPGIVHKTLRTGFGSPTGICFNEGSLLPKQYANALVHADAGPREIRAFIRKPKGAGYELDKIIMLTSSDSWFRPSDVCMAPDGSVFVSDWYDPGVGGHGMGDWTRGRIYRLTPSGHKGYKVPEVKLDTKEGMLESLGSPNGTARIAAIRAMAKASNDKSKAINWEATYRSKESKDLTADDFRLYARVFQAAGSYEGPRQWWNLTALLLDSRRPELMQLGLRMCAGRVSSNQQVIKDFTTQPDESAEKVDAGTRREFLLMTRAIDDTTRLSQTLLQLAKLYDGQDIFYRAALNIACGTDPERRDKILADFDKHFPEWNDKVADLVWELRPKCMLPKMEQLLVDSKLTAVQKARIVDIIAANDDVAAGKSMLALLGSEASPEVKARAAASLKQFLPTKWNTLAKSDELKQLTGKYLADAKTAALGLQLAMAMNSPDYIPEIAKLAGAKSQPLELRKEAIRTLGAMHGKPAASALGDLLSAVDDPLPAVILTALGNQVTNQPNDAASTLAMGILQRVVIDKDRILGDDRKAALAALASSRAGTGWLLKQKEEGKLPDALTADAGRLLRNSPFQGERNKAMLLFPAPGKMTVAKLPAIPELAKRTGNADHGKAILAKSMTNEVQCLKCHTIRGQGGQIGPDLSMIGKKGSRENLFESILYPSKAIADQYLTYKLDTEDGQSITGLLVQETESNYTLRDANGKDYTVPVKGTEKKKLTTSLMADNLVAGLTEDELVDVVEYLATLQTASFTPSKLSVNGPHAIKAGDQGIDAVVPSRPNAVWLKPDAKGYFDLAAYHGDPARNSFSQMSFKLESPIDQEATILLGTDDGCRLLVNGERVFGHDRTEAATPERDRVTVILKKGLNELTLKVANGDNPHGFYLTITSGQELKAK